MKQVVNKAGKITVENVPAPVVRDGYVLVSNLYSLISPGTESAIIKQSSGGTVMKIIKKPELIRNAIDRIKADGIKSTIDLIRYESEKLSELGYSSAGSVIDKGKNIDNVDKNDRVACGGCAYHAGIVCVPKNLVVRIPEEVGFDEAAFTTVGSIALQGVRRAKVEVGDVVVVLGLGLVGQLTAQILNASGCRVIGIDLNRDKVKLAEKLGLYEGIVAGEEDVVKSVLDYTSGNGADAVIICAATSSNQPVNQAMEIARKKGKIVVVGDVGMNLQRHPFYEKELDFLISTSYGPGRYDPLYEEKGIDYPIGYVRWTENRNMQEFLWLVAERRVDVKSLITHEFPIDKAREAYSVIKDPEKYFLGVLLRYQKIEKKKIERKVFLGRRSEKKSDKINVAVIGCGSFAKAVHLPNLKNISDYNIKAIVSATGINAKQVAKQYEVEYCSTDFNEVLRDKSIDMVLIATRHNLHASISIAAAKAQKDIFIEKPMAMNYKECKNVANTVRENKILFTIGFNRRFSPLSLKAKKLLKRRNAPVMMNYTVNAGKLTPNHWVHDPVEGGGRMIGEACHFFDLLYWFIESEPIEIFTRGISSRRHNLIDDENCITTIKFADGSTASLTYTSLGHPSFPKEKIEIFADGNVILIDNFKKLTVGGWYMRKQCVELRKVDKGHYNELVAFSKVLKGEKPLLITVEDGIRATVCSLKALESLRSGKPVDVNLDKCL